MKDCVFCKIAKHEMPKEFDYEDDDVMVFPDINPLKPVHILVVPKKHMTDFLALEDMELFAKTKKVIDQVIKDQKLTDKGFRVSTNGGGAQLIDHLHFHVNGPIDRSAEI